MAVIRRYHLVPAAKRLGVYWEGFGWHSFRRKAVTSMNSALGTAQAMRLAGHTRADLSLHYTLPDQQAQETAIRARQEAILGKPESDRVN